MAAGLPRASTQENVSTTLSTGVSDSDVTFSVADASKLVAPCYLVVDRVDSSGTLKSTSLWEYVKVTNIAGSDLTVTRAQGGSSAQSHSSGAVIEAVSTAAMFTDWYTALNPEHTASGGHVITGTMTVAGMQLASVATIAVAGIGTTNSNILRAVNHLNASGASLSGMGLNPTWFIPSLPSLATTGLGRPMAMPRAGTLQFVTVTLNNIVSSPSVFFDITKNGSSIFSAIGRPFIANSTFVSTASIATKNFNAGDVLRVDYSLVGGANAVDAVVTASSY